MRSTLELNSAVRVRGGRLGMPGRHPCLAGRGCGDAGPMGGLAEPAPASVEEEDGHHS